MDLHAAFDPDQVEARNALRLSEAGAAVIPIIAHDEEGRRQWAEEVAIMRRGDNVDWLAWSPACRVGWAASMIDVGREFEIEDGEAIDWLGGIK